MRQHERHETALRKTDGTRTTLAGEFQSGHFSPDTSVAATLGTTALTALLLGAEVSHVMGQDIIQQGQEPTEEPDDNGEGQVVQDTDNEGAPTLTPVAITEAPEVASVSTGVPTNTPTPEQPFPTTTPTATQTPEAGETSIAMASLDSSRFVEASQLDRFPRTIRYTNRFHPEQGEVQVQVNPDRLSQLLTINGIPLPLGVYDEQHPLPIDSRAFDGFQEWSGGDLRPVYIVGILTEVNGWQDQNPNPTTSYTNPELVVALPLPGSRGYFPVDIWMGTTGGRFCAIDNTGGLVPLPENLLDSMGRIPYQSNGVNHITYSSAEDWIAFPTSQDTTILRAGDPIIVRVVFNLDVYNESYRRSFIVGSSGRMPEQVVTDLYDNNPANDGQWYQESSALATIFTPYNGIAQR